MKMKVTQSCPTLCDPMDYTGQNTGVGTCSLLLGIFPTQGSNPGLPHCRRIFYQLSHKGNPRILEWVAYPFSRGSSQPRNQTTGGLLHCRWVLYQLSYQGSPITEGHLLTMKKAHPSKRSQCQTHIHCWDVSGSSVCEDGI